jgi:hypothetical protein
MRKVVRKLNLNDIVSSWDQQKVSSLLWLVVIIVALCASAYAIWRIFQWQKSKKERHASDIAIKQQADANRVAREAANQEALADQARVLAARQAAALEVFRAIDSMPGGVAVFDAVDDIYTTGQIDDLDDEHQALLDGSRPGYIQSAIAALIQESKQGNKSSFERLMELTEPGDDNLYASYVGEGSRFNPPSDWIEVVLACEDAPDAKMLHLPDEPLRVEQVQMMASTALEQQLITDAWYVITQCNVEQFFEHDGEVWPYWPYRDAVGEDRLNALIDMVNADVRSRRAKRALHALA